MLRKNVVKRLDFASAGGPDIEIQLSAMAGDSLRFESNLAFTLTLTPKTTASSAKPFPAFSNNMKSTLVANVDTVDCGVVDAALSATAPHVYKYTATAANGKAIDPHIIITT